MAVKTEAEKRAMLDSSNRTAPISYNKRAAQQKDGLPSARKASMPGRGKKSASVGK